MEDTWNKNETIKKSQARRMTNVYTGVSIRVRIQGAVETMRKYKKKKKKRKLTHFVIL